MKATAVLKVRFAIISVAYLAFSSFAQDATIVKVMGRGVGTDKVEALKDAYRDAVERAVGLYVDAEQMMKNEELVKDQILTQSNAYIEKYDVVRENAKTNGLVEIQILAEVRKKVLSRKISDVMPAITFALGGELRDAHAKITTIEKRNQDGAELLKEFLKDFDPLRSTLDLTLASPKMLIKESGDSGCITGYYFFQWEINQDRYFNDVVPKLREILRQVSISDPIVETIGCAPDKKINVERCVDNDILQASKRPGYNLERQFYTGRVGLDLEYDKRLNQNCLCLVVERNKYNTAYKIEKYELDESCLNILWDWCVKNHLHEIYSDAPLFTVSFINKESEILYCEDVKPWPDKGVHSESRLNMIAKRPYCGGCGPYAIAPWHWRGNRGWITFRKYGWFGFQIPKDVMPEIANMKIEMK